MTPVRSLPLSEPVSNPKTATTSRVITGSLGANPGPSLEEMPRGKPTLLGGTWGSEERPGKHMEAQTSKLLEFNRTREELSDLVGASQWSGHSWNIEGSLCPPSWPLVGYEGPLCGWVGGQWRNVTGHRGWAIV